MVTLEKGAIVAHFKRFLPQTKMEDEPNKYLYEIVDIAINCSDEGKTMVAYRALYGEKMLFVRSVEDFTAYVLNVGRYRFEPWEGEEK